MYKKHLSFEIWCDLYQRFYSNYLSLPGIKLILFFKFAAGLRIPVLSVISLIDIHRQTSNISQALVDNQLVDHSDVWSIACLLHLHSPLKPGFTGLFKDNCTTRCETFKFCDLVWLILDTLWYFTFSTP